MKNLIIPLLFVLVLVFSCKKENQNKTILQPLDSIEIVTDTISLEFECLWWGDGANDSAYKHEYLIRNEFEYDSLLKNKCPKYSLPDIDFTKYMLAGFKIINGDDSLKIIKQVKKDNINNIMIYHINVYADKNFGSNEMGFQSMCWLLIPQLPANWSFKIDTNVIFIN